LVQRYYPSLPRGALLRLVFILVSLLGIAWAVVPCLAQETSPEKPQHPLRPGVWALELEVQPRLTDFTGAAGIAVKRHFGTRSALRFGALARLQGNDADGTTQRDDIDLTDSTTVVTPFEETRDYRDINLFAHYLRFVGLGDRFGMFVEAGPGVRWISSEAAAKDIFGTADSYYRAFEANEWRFGLDFQAGFEWFFYPKLSLSGRYGLTALMTDTDITEEAIYNSPSVPAYSRQFRTTHEEGYWISTSPAILSLTAYF
jgi:hypothetical protein